MKSISARFPVPLCAALIALFVAILPVRDVSAEDELPLFDIWEFEISGNTQLEASDIERAVYPFLGPDRTIKDVELARDALKELYRDAGLGAAVVNIPVQDINEGMVRLEVLEGRVERVIVSGATYFSPERIKEGAPSMAPGQVLNLPQVQRDILNLNMVNRDRRITTVLRPGSVPGTTEVDLKVDDSLPVHGSLELNNEYSRDTERLRLVGSLSYSNLWQKEHTALIGYQTSPEDRDDVEVFFGTYTMRLGSGWIGSGSYIKSNSDVASIGTTGVIGKGDIAGLTLVRPLGSIAGGFHSVSLSLNYKDFDESVGLIGSDTGIETPINYWAAGADYDLSFKEKNEITEIGIGVTFAPSFLGNDQDEFDNKRAGSQANFAYIDFRFAREQMLWAKSAYRFRARGRLADSPLISNEQFSFGGAQTVRGYLESQQLVDNGYTGQFELIAPEFGSRFWQKMQTNFFAFTDAGGGLIKDPLPEQKDDFFLWSAGLGLRMVLWNSLSLDLDWAYPLRDSDDGGEELDDMGNVIDEIPPSVEKGDDRWHFRVNFSF